MAKNLGAVYKMKLMANILKLSHAKFLTCDLDLMRSRSNILYFINGKEFKGH